MTVMNTAQPDVTLILDISGVIQDITLSNAIAGESVKAWLGRPWEETVADVGGDKVRRMLADARTSGLSAFRQLTQRFPSGLELPMEYTMVRLGGDAGMVAIGKNLQAVADLQSRLISAQQAMERDYWKLREVETRYRFLFDASNEAVLLIKASNLRVAEANPAAIRVLGAGIAGEEILPELAAQEREPFQAMLLRVREQGKAPGMLVHFGSDRKACLIRASLLSSEAGPTFLLQLAPVGTVHPDPAKIAAIPVEELFERLPDGFVVIDNEGVVRRANRAFLDLVQVGAEGSLVGERLGRWLSRPGADLTVLLANVARRQFVRLFSTTIHGELGTDTEVEISAAGNVESAPDYIAVLIRDVGRRLATPVDANRLRAALGSLSEQIGKTSLRELVRDSVGLVERHYIEAALERTDGNRTAASELLGLSRQSLYAKLDRYGLHVDPKTSEGRQ